ncbi:tetratricopeptide repeat protein [Marinilongibacter aquaticus]|uniref:tetratricopeptide repeat protein n=1 Tax=Marinilongibacter aquaticus TaxID=2975157 RepID=UPI0021BDB553|nr:tetratricopeptide repeat protein [Marinilongibacter aquaticus]UBM59466.1 tetratricopeptide repeat protein [Marinilongibacter aquaticus]
MKKSVLIALLTGYSAFGQNTLSYTEIEAHYNNGVELYEKRAYTAARKEFKNYVDQSSASINPNEFNIANAEYYSAVCALNTNAKDADIEVQRFVLNHSEHPKAKIIYSDLGEKFFESGDYQKAIEYLKKAVEYRQDDLAVYELHYKLGVAYYQLKDFKNALKEFDYVKRTSAENALNAAYYSGVINYQNEDYDLALDDLHRVENVNPYKLEVPQWIAQILYKQKKYDELVRYAEPIIANPQGRKTDEICFVTAEVFFFQNDFRKAADYYDRFAELRRGKVDPQITFRHGFSLYKTEQYAKVIDVMKKIGDREDELGQQAAYYLGISALQTGDLNSAMAAFDFARKTDFDSEIKEEAAFNYSKVLVDLGNNELAINSLQEYLASYPNGKHVDQSNELLSDLLFQTKDYRRAIAYIEGLSNKTPKIEEAYQKLCYSEAVNDFNAEKMDEAIKYFDKAIYSAYNKDVARDAMFWKAEASFAAGKSNTEQLYREVLQKGNAEQKNKSLYSLGYLAFNREEYAKAQSYFSDFLGSRSGSSSRQMQEDAQLRLADCYLIQRNFSTALREYEKALANNSSDKDYALYQKAVTLNLLGRTAEADRTFSEMSRVYENSRLLDDALFRKGSLEMDKNNYQSAIATFTEMLRKRPKSKLVPNALLKRALAYGNTENYDRAIADYKILINRFSQHETANEALIGLRDILNLTGRSEDFAEIAEEYQKNNPGSNSAIALQYDAARNLFYNEKYEASISAMKKFIASNPNNANVVEGRFLIGEAYYFTDRANESLPYFKDVLEDGQSQYVSRAAFRVGDIEFKNKNYREAISGYQNVLSSSQSKRDQVMAWEGLFKAYYNMGDFDNCVKYCQEAIAKGGGAVMGIENKAQLYIGKTYLKRENYDQAKKQFEKVIAMGKDANAAEAKYLLGEILYQKRQYKESIKEMQSLAQEYGDFIEWYENAFLLIADNYIADGDTFMAKATLNSIIENSGNPETVDRAQAKLRNLPK